MGLTTGTRAMAGTAGATAAIGLVAVLYSSLRNDLARALGGTCLTLVAITAVALILIRHWIVDTRDERRVLGAAQREAQAERSRYFAAKAALENEQGRLNRDMAAERAGLAARMMAEREVMAADFEEHRATLISETMEATVLMILNGKMTSQEPNRSKVIQFPQQHPQAERERSRGHEVVGP